MTNSDLEVIFEGATSQAETRQAPATQLLDMLAYKLPPQSVPPQWRPSPRQAFSEPFIAGTFFCPSFLCRCRLFLS